MSNQKTTTEPQKANSAKTEGQRFLVRLLKAHETWYDVQENYPFAGETFDGYAEFHTHGEQYVLVKKAKLWEADSHEYLFFTLRNTVDGKEMKALVSFMTTQALQKVDPVPNHMSSAITLVVIADEVDDEARRLIRKTSFKKNFTWGFRGWATLRLALVELQQRNITTNSAARAMTKMLTSNLAFLDSE